MVTTPFHAFRAKIREAADIPAIVAELERAVREAVQPRFAHIWADAMIATAWPAGSPLPPFDPQDPLVGYALRHSDARLLAGIELGSPALDACHAIAAHTIVPLVSLGVFVGLLVLGPPQSGSGYASSDLAMLEEIAAQAAATLRVARLTQQHEASERAWESNAEELRIAQQIQRSLLPETLPELPGWQFDAHYRPARVVGGDLYDFIPLPGDLLGFVVGDASDKSVPAALVMATTRTLVRSAALRVVLPGQVLARANEDLCAQIPPGMFVTCFIAILDTASGRLRYANAGHCPPYLYTSDGVTELRASGWPLGIMPGATYDEGEVTIAPGNALVCFSDGLTETHGPDGDMFGTSRIVDVLASNQVGAPLVEALLASHEHYAGPEWDQEDDLTIVALARIEEQAIQADPTPETMVLANFSVPSLPDNERAAADQVLNAVRDLPLTQRQRDRLRTAVAEAVMNATEHGNRYRADLAVSIQVIQRGADLIVRVSDSGLGGSIPEPTTPNLEAKLAGLQSPRGWGLFLIEKMVDRVEVIETPDGQTVELTIRLESQPEARN